MTRASILWDIPYWGCEGVRRNGGIIVVYADGHSRWVLLEPNQVDFWVYHSSEGWDSHMIP